MSLLALFAIVLYTPSQTRGANTCQAVDDPCLLYVDLPEESGNIDPTSYTMSSEDFNAFVNDTSGTGEDLCVE